MSYAERGDLDDEGQVAPTDAAALLEIEPRVFVRLAIDVGTSPVAVLRAEFTAGAELDASEPEVWDYGSLVLASVLIDGAEACEWIKGGSGKISLPGRGDVAFRLPDLHDTGTWRRLPAHAGYDTPGISTPYRRFAFTSPAGNAASRHQQTWFVCREGPSFPSVAAAVHGFFSRTELASSSSTNSDALTVRLAETGPRIARLRFTPVELVVVLDGVPPELEEPLRVELYLAGHRSRTDLSSEPWQAAFPLAPERVGEWWTVVSAGNRWLDYRRSPAVWQASPGVELEPPGLSAKEELEAILARGECTTAEFKRQLPDTSAEARKMVCRTVAAFANGDGGAMLFGIDKDEVTIVGVQEILTSARDRLNDIIDGNLTATPPFEVRKFDTGDGAVLGLFVAPGDETPYGVDKLNPRFYVRTNASTRPATAEQVRQFVRSRSEPPSDYGSHVL